MKLFTMITILLLSISCQKNESKSQVIENQVLAGQELSKAEELKKAFLERDYDKLTELFEKGTAVDEVLDDGKTLLYMGVEGIQFQMVDFLMGKGADAEKTLIIKEVETTTYLLVESLENPKEKDVMTKILEGKFKEAALFLLIQNIESVNTGEEYDIDWLTFLYQSTDNLDEITKDDFNKKIMKKSSLASNSNDLYKLMGSDKDRIPVDQWMEWLEEGFVKGRYRRANCTFHTSNQCFTFEEFLQTCGERYRRQLQRAKSKLWPYISFRNNLLDCGGKYID